MLDSSNRIKESDCTRLYAVLLSAAEIAALVERADDAIVAAKLRETLARVEGKP